MYPSGRIKVVNNAVVDVGMREMRQNAKAEQRKHDETSRALRDIEAAASKRYQQDLVDREHQQWV